MTGIYDILKAHGVELAEEKKKDFEKDFFGNYKSVAEMQKKDETISSLTDQLNTAKEGMKKFDGVNVDDLKNQITKLQGDITAKEAEWKMKFDDAEFSHSVEGAISIAKGRDAKAIMALLDMDALKSSKDRSKDIKTAVDNLKKEKSYLFEPEGKPGQYSGGTGSGRAGRAGYDPEMDAFRRAAGLKTAEEK